MATNILNFSMNRCTRVEKLDDNRLKSVCSLNDTVTTAEISIVVQMPDLEIKSVQGSFQHAYHEPIHDLNGLLKNLEGVRVGSGMLKIIKGLLGDTDNLKQVVYMVEESCHGIILTLTRNILTKAPDDEAGKAAFFSKMVEKNIRLYDRCAAFAKGSPLVENYEKQNG